MSDTIAGLLGFGLIAVLFVAYVIERRKRFPRRLRTAQGAQGAHDGEGAQDMLGAQDAQDAQGGQEARGQERAASAADDSPPARPTLSGNLGPAIAYVFLLVGAATHRHSFWGYLWQGLYLAILAVTLTLTLSPKAFAEEQARFPDVRRREYVLTMLVPYVLLPLAGWVLVGPVGWSGGVIVAVLPWLLLYGVAFVAAGVQGAARAVRRAS